MISCKKAAIICNKSQYKEASNWEIMKLRLHLLICKGCKQYSQDNTQLSSLCSKAVLNNLSDEEKTKMKKELQKEI